MNVPFFPNTSDGTHCFQASLAMILGYFNPGTKFTIEELDKISAKLPGKWTWPTAAMLWLLNNGYELHLIEEFDYDDFAKRGKDYIMERCGKEVGKSQIAHSEIERELGYARQFAKLNLVDRRIPNFKDVKFYLERGYLLMCNINSAALIGAPGYSGHFVVVYKCRKDAVVFHDPGLPPRPAVEVGQKLFEKAWAYPTEKEKNLLAIRLSPKGI